MVIKNLMRECNDLASRYYKLEASDRQQGYELWLKKVKKVAHFIDIFKEKDSKTDLKKSVTFLHPAKNGSSSGFRAARGKKSNKSNRKVTA